MFKFSKPSALRHGRNQPVPCVFACKDGVLVVAVDQGAEGQLANFDAEAAVVAQVHILTK
jgi:hypothetical protein